MPGKYWEAAGQHEAIFDELHESIKMQEFNKNFYIEYYIDYYIELLEDTIIQDIEYTIENIELFKW